ncbi:MAG TPA: hypothetical protein VFB03_01800 [Candidatus Saccharimonadales bacterium]|nr:hypothetical protein [Candidatus Saccharimonadales bacterium]
MADVILAVLIFTPAIITFVLKSNAALGYLTLCGSFVLITFANADLQELSGHLSLSLDSGTLNLILLVSPLLLTLLLTRRAFSGELKRVFYILTSLCAGGLLALIAVPLLNASSRTDFVHDWGWNNLQKIQALVIATGFVLSLFLIWFNGLSKRKAAKHHK